jgi:hypothetical protein
VYQRSHKAPESNKFTISFSKPCPPLILPLPTLFLPRAPLPVPSHSEPSFPFWATVSKNFFFLDRSPLPLRHNSPPTPFLRQLLNYILRLLRIAAPLSGSIKSHSACAWSAGALPNTPAFAASKTHGIHHLIHHTNTIFTCLSIFCPSVVLLHLHPSRPELSAPSGVGLQYRRVLRLHSHPYGYYLTIQSFSPRCITSPRAPADHPCTASRTSIPLCNLSFLLRAKL